MNPSEQPKIDPPTDAPEESLAEAPHVDDEEDDRWAYFPFAD